MPIATQMMSLKSGYANIMKLKVTGNASMVGLLWAQTMAAAAPSGIQMIGGVPTPVVPGAFPVCKTAVETVYKTGSGGTISACAQSIASGMAALCPTVPPTGLSLLIQQVQSAINLQVTSTPDTFGAAMASATLAYFTAGLVT